MDFAETADQALLRDAVRRIAADFGHEYYARKARGNQHTTELWDAVARGGYVGVNVPARYGGGGMGISELAILAEELAAQGCPLMLLLVSPGVSATILARFGTEAQQAHWLPGLASGEAKIVLAVTEPDAGSNSHRLATTATRQDGAYRLRGTKHYITGADEADALLVLARTGVEADGRGRLSLFVVDADAAGLEQTPIPLGFAVPEKQFTLFFDDVTVATDRLVGSEGDGLRQAFAGLNAERIVGAASANGISRYALARAAEYAGQRRVWDVPIGAHQGLAHPLAAAKIDVELARLMTQKAAWCHDTGAAGVGEAANMAKYAAAESALAAVDAAIETHGGHGFAAEFGLTDLWGIVRALRTAPVSREMVLNFVAEHSLGLPRSY